MVLILAVDGYALKPRTIIVMMTTAATIATNPSALMVTPQILTKSFDYFQHGVALHLKP